MSHRIAIIGAGLMGTGLARLFTARAWPTAVSDPDAAARQRLAETVPTAQITASAAEACDAADFIIEAAPERPPLKQSIFSELLRVAPAHAILATNSSVISVGVITQHLTDTEAARVTGAHFWNPPDVIPLVEVIQGPRTGIPAIETAMRILTEAGKEPVHVHRDTVPGNRLQHALWREAMALVDEGVCSAPDVDHIVKRSFGLRLPVLGPLENADLVGLALTEDIHRVVLPTLSRATEPAACLRQLRAEGAEGVATNRGFYRWTPESVTALRSRLVAHLRALLR
jgi:3-hydroxybutyryl-CoA dehydrogenase